MTADAEALPLYVIVDDREEKWEVPKQFVILNKVKPRLTAGLTFQTRAIPEAD